MISVKDAPFNAKADGSDDRAAIQHALDAAAATGDQVYFPPGTYMVGRAPSTNYSLLIGASNLTLIGVKGRSFIKQVANVSSGTTSCSLFLIQAAQNVAIRDLGLDGNWGNAQTTVAAPSDGLVLGSGPLDIAVASTAGFPPSGRLKIVVPGGAQVITYTSIVGNTFKGCSGGAGTLRGDGDLGRIGSAVGYVDPGHARIDPASDGQQLGGAFTLHVTKTTSFLPSGTITVQIADGEDQVLTYSAITSNTFAITGGGTGTLTSEDLHNEVWGGADGINQLTQRDPHNHLVFCHAVGGDNVNIEISGCLFRQAYGDGVWIGGDGTAGGRSGHIGGTRHMVVRDCTFDMCARNGVTLIYADGVRIERCRFTNIFTTAIDTEPVEAQVTNVAISDCDLDVWWNPFHEPVLNALSIQGGTTSRPSEWNLARGYRVDRCKIKGNVLVTDAVDVVITNNQISCDFDAESLAPIVVEMFCDDVWITDNYLYARNGATNTGNRGVVNINRFQLDTIAAMQPGNIYVRGNAIHARGGMDGVYVDGTGGGDGYTGTASAVTAKTLTDAGAAWIANQFIGHQVVVGGVVATVDSNTATALKLATWHNDDVHGWFDARGNPQATPAAGGYRIQPTGGIVTVEDNAIDCVASDGRSAGRYGIHVTSNDPGGVWDVPTQRMRAVVHNNAIRGANPHGIHVFLYAPPAMPFLSITGNQIWDNQLVPTCSHGVFFDNHAGSFDVDAQIGKLVLRDNTTDNVGVNVGGLVAGVWLHHDGEVQRWVGFGAPESNLSAPIGSTFLRKDGGRGTTLYVKEDAGLPIHASAKTNRSGVRLSTDQTLALDSVTTTVDHCLVVAALVARPGSGSSAWDQWTNAALVDFTQILQDTSSSGGGDLAAAAGIQLAAGPTGTGTVRQHATSAEEGNGTVSFALTPQVPGVPPTWVANGTKTQGGAGTIAPPWPTHQEGDVAILLVQITEGDTAAIADPHWAELPNSPVDGAMSGAGVRMHLFGARAYKTSMPAPTVAHSGANIMAEIMVFRGAAEGSSTGWAAK